MPEGNLYELLQVEPSAGLPEIRAAYRRLVLQYHPDRNPEADAQEMTQRLNRAYEVLSDPAQKAAYDWRLSGEPGRPPGWEDQERVDPSSGPRSGVRFFGGLPRSAWLAGTGAVAIAAVVVVVVVLAAVLTTPARPSKLSRRLSRLASHQLSVRQAPVPLKVQLQFRPHPHQTLLSCSRVAKALSGTATLNGRSKNLPEPLI